MKKFLAMMVAFCLIAALLPATALAASNPARFVFCNGEREANLEVVINEGDNPVFLKTQGKKVTAAGATADDYNIKVTYNAGENPTVYLKGAEVQSYGDASADSVITIGSPNADDACNNLDVDIVVEKNSTFSHTKTYGEPHILSYITGTLTITRTKGLLTLGHKLSPTKAAIQAVGDIVLKDANISIASGLSGQDRAYGIRTTKGSITIDGGKLNITTNSSASASEQPTSRRMLYTESTNGNITIKNGAVVKITLKNAAKAFGTKGDLIIQDSTVSVAVQGNDLGTIFDENPPIFEGYANGYTALGDEAEYDEDKYDTYKSFSIEPNESAVEDTTPATDPSAPANDPSTPVTDPSAPATNPPETQPSTGNKAEPNNNTIILVVALVVIVAAVAAAAVILLKKKKEDDVVEEVVEVVEVIEEVEE